MPPNKNKKLNITTQATSARATATSPPLPPSVVLPAPEAAYHPTYQHPTLGTPPSPVTTTPLSAKDAAAPFGADLRAVGELLGTMKLTLSALGATFDTLGEQAMKIAELGPAIDATHQIHLVRKELSNQHERQEERMQGVKKLLSEELRVQLRDYLTPRVNLIVRNIIQREVAERVRRQMRVQIPDSLREEIQHSKRQITAVKHALYNSEARRHNRLIRSTALDEPLRPLLCPLSVHVTPPPASPPSPPIRSDVDTAYSSVPPNSSVEPTVSATHAGRSSAPPPPEALRTPYPSVSPLLSVPPQTSASLSELPRTPDSDRETTAGGLPAVSDVSLEMPTPSPLFPRDLAGLMRLGPEAIRTLLSDYGLAALPLRRAENPEMLGAVGAEKVHLEVTGDGVSQECSREESLNRFMEHIGVGFQLIPSSPALVENVRGKGQPRSASITRVLHIH